jgi:ABC-type transport system involved in multi-copper enzyme maturation permease subunit
MTMCCRQLAALCALSLRELYRRKDIWVVFTLGLLILAPLAAIKPFGVGGASRHLSEIALLLIWISAAVIAISVAGRQFPPEFEHRTIYPMLAKPVSRTTLLAGKFLGAWVASVSATGLFYLAYGLFAGAKLGIWFPAVFCQAFALHVGFLTLVTALSLLGSFCLTPAANLTVCGVVVCGMFAVGQRLPEMTAGHSAPLRALARLIYWVAPHVEFFDLRRRVVHEWGPVGWPVAAAVLIYAVVYAGACLLLAGWIFRRRRC